MAAMMNIKFQNIVVEILIEYFNKVAHRFGLHHFPVFLTAVFFFVASQYEKHAADYFFLCCLC